MSAPVLKSAYLFYGADIGYIQVFYDRNGNIVYGKHLGSVVDVDKIIKTMRGIDWFVGGKSREFLCNHLCWPWHTYYQPQEPSL